ncbi:pH-response regulator protein palA/RIM20 [Candida maltosa Xu316]|uniref:pH-response regulator protein palA/RIM20 n=1 Tax=Candida maltosa (strain Xu316) TaxID=1245528 RepID=M3K495_CANMX|nr:pH-response regulator protein palA/RIM20 [Candida maltosa Xu316]
MNSNLLYIPLKQSRPIDFGNELRQVITNNYFQPASSFDSDLNYLTQLRNNVTDIKDLQTNSNGKSESYLLEYFQILGPIQRKFSDDCVEFAWYDTLAYGPQGPFAYRSLKVEKLNSVFQLGCLYSQMAIVESRHTDLGLKKSCHNFQLSSGCFQYILDFLEKELSITNNPLFLQIPKNFQIETIRCLKYLMLAQAQEIIWQKAINNASMKDSVIARLSLQTSEYYSQALIYGDASDLIKLEWINHIKVKKFHFLAAAHLRASTIAADALQYGEQVAHLRVASSTIDQALKNKKYVNPLVLEDLSGLADVIKTRLRTAEKDNDLVYLKIVPPESDLKPIISVSMVKSVEPEQFNKNPHREIFKELLPYVIINVAQALRERQDDFIRTRFLEPIQSLNTIFTKFLNERGLPASIDSLQQPENIPDSIIHHSKEILNNGGYEFIDRSFQEIQNLKTECDHLLKECQNRIALDRTEDDMLRNKQGSVRWTRATTDEAASEIITKTSKMNQYLEQASKGDESIVQKYCNIKPILEVYSGGYDALTKYIPNSSYLKLPDNLLNIVIELRSCLSQGSAIETERQNFIQELEIKSRDNNILPKLIKEYNTHSIDAFNEDGDFQPQFFEPVYEKHIKIFNSDLQKLENSKEAQVKLEQEIGTINDRFRREFNHVRNASQEKRQSALQQLEHGFEKFLEIVTNLNEGSKFYMNFIEKGTNVLRECEEYLYKRRIESRDLELAINNSFQQQQQQQPIEIPPKKDEHEHLVSPRTSKPGIWNPNSDIKFS